MANFMLKSTVILLFFSIITIIPNTFTIASSIHYNQTRHVDCERQCPFIYYPICATNGNETENRMFVNHCEMNAWNCDAEKKYHRTRHSQCPDYEEYVDELWQTSHGISFKPTKKPHAHPIVWLTGEVPQTIN